MIEHMLLGIIQGVAEWLPVSSEGLIVLAKLNWFHSQENIETMIHQALFLHIGTFLAALIYFRRDIVLLLRSVFLFRTQSVETKKMFVFLLTSTVISGALGLALIKLLSHLDMQTGAQARIITVLIGCLLLGTAYLELRSRTSGARKIQDLNAADGVLLGLAQGMAALPGLSRSGLTVSTLLLRKIDRSYALKLSFLMSLPIVLCGNILLNFNAMAWSMEALAGTAFAFIFGLATIHLLLKLAETVNFGYFVLIFGIVTIVSAAV